MEAAGRRVKQVREKASASVDVPELTAALPDDELPTVCPGCYRWIRKTDSPPYWKTSWKRGSRAR